MLRLMLMTALLLGLVSSAHARQPFAPRRFDPAPSPVFQAAPSEPTKQWLDCLDPGGRPAKVYGWRTADGMIRYWDAENPHLAARPQPAPAAEAPTGAATPTVNYGVNLPTLSIGESTRTNDRGFAESVIQEQERPDLPSPGGLFDRLRPKPKPCPGPEPCPVPDDVSGIEDPGEKHPIQFAVLAAAGVAIVVALTALIVAGVFAVVSHPRSRIEAPVHVAR